MIRANRHVVVHLEETGMISRVRRHPVVAFLTALVLATGQNGDIFVHVMLLIAIVMMLSYTLRPD
jgi:hypothetical protein